MQGNIAEEKILRAAFEVIDKNTISGTRMHLIAEEAGMVQSNLHYYFKTKKELLMALLQYIQRNFTQQREQELKKHESSLTGQLGGFFEQKKQILLGDQKYDRAQFDYWSLGQVDSDINDCFQETMDIWRRQIEQTILRYDSDLPEARAQMAAGIMVSMMMGVSMQYLNKPGLFDLDDYFEACMGMILSYLDG